jgi:hypothetical protein
VATIYIKVLPKRVSILEKDTDVSLYLYAVKQRIYIDTSVIGGYYDEEFEEHTKRLFERIRNKDFDIYFSEVNEAELILAPQNVQDLKKIIPLTVINILN